LLLPLVLWICLRTQAPRSYSWALFVGFLCLGVVSRIILWKAYAAAGMHGFNDYYPNIYYSTLCRFDEFLPGLAVAALKNFHPNAWARLTRRGHGLLVTGSIATGLMFYGIYYFYHIDDYGYGFFMTAFGYSLMSLAFAVLVLAALSPNSLLYRLRVPGAYHIALWSYSTYLSHKAVFNIVGKYSDQFKLSGAVTLIIATTASIACGALLYSVVELPFMTLRDRLFPSLVHPS
jgi:peptidoglycan/LPS O-acetylase OafA/YrhL